MADFTVETLLHLGPIAGPALAETVTSRLRHGPAHPDWDVRTEFICRLQRRLMLPCKDLLPSQQRERVDKAAAALTVLAPSKGLTERDATISGVPCTWTAPDGVRVDDASAPTVLYLHGGGYVVGSMTMYRAQMRLWAKVLGARVCYVDYRLAPQHPCPAAIDDAEAAWRGLLDDGCDPARTVFMGDSAGGGLSAAVLQRLRDDGVAMPAGAVLLCPFGDVACDGPHAKEHERTDFLTVELGRVWADMYRGTKPVTDPECSPVHGDFTGLPPLHVEVGGAEILYDDGMALAAKATADGVDVDLVVEDAMFHVWQQQYGLVPAADRSVKRIKAFVGRVTAA